jgi:hypothetical protein
MIALNPLTVGGFVFTICLLFSYAMYHIITLEEEKRQHKKQVAVIEPSLEEVDTSQGKRTKQERFEYEMEMLNQRIHLITFRATAEEAEFILGNVPEAAYLANLSAEDMDNHVIEARYRRQRSYSA